MEQDKRANARIISQTSCPSILCNEKLFLIKINLDGRDEKIIKLTGPVFFSGSAGATTSGAGAGAAASVSDIFSLFFFTHKIYFTCTISSMPFEPRRDFN